MSHPETGPPVDALLEAFWRRRRRAQVVPQSARAGGFAHLAGSAARLSLAHEAFWRWPEPATGTLRQKSYLEHPLGSQMRTRIPFVGGLSTPSGLITACRPIVAPSESDVPRETPSLGHYLAVQQMRFITIPMRPPSAPPPPSPSVPPPNAPPWALTPAPPPPPPSPSLRPSPQSPPPPHPPFPPPLPSTPPRAPLFGIGAMSVRFVSFIGRVSVREAALLSLVLALMTLLISAH